MHNCLILESFVSDISNKLKSHRESYVQFIATENIVKVLKMITNSPICVASSCVCLEVMAFLNFCDFEVASFSFQFVSHVWKLRRYCFNLHR